MARQAFLILGALIMVSVCLQGCATLHQSDVSESDNKYWQNRNTVPVDNPSIDLATYLQQIPGLTVSGNGDNAVVFLRGINSIRNNSEPLFVIDNQQVGNSYAAVSSLIDVNDIRSIEVLKGPEAGALYGMPGSNGVVIIQTRKM
jgi:TonB-dependent SusC/RagA subfamily outer membrane receptor